MTAPANGGPFSLKLYAALTGLAEPLAPSALRGRVRKGKEDPARLGERLGHASSARPAGKLAWLHGASVGESLSLLPLVEAIRAGRPDAAVLVTSGTRTSADLLAQRLPRGVIHQYLPIDAPGPARRFIEHWRPDLGVFVESELWPNLLLAARTGGVRMALLSAKLSDSSYRNWRAMPGAARALLSGFTLILAQDGRAANRFESLGVTIGGTADLKFGSEALPVDDAALAALRGRIGGRAVLLAASTHTGEDQMILRRFAPLVSVHDPSARDGAGLAPQLVIVPRHPERGPAIAAAAAAQGFTTARQGAGEAAGATQVYVADVMGEIGLWFRLARIAVMGGSLVQGVGGHNPLEPARLGCPVASGPYVDNWASAYRALELAEGVARISEAEGLETVLRRAAMGDTALTDMAARARTLVERRDAEARGVAGRILALLP